jgi:hypothetical protein
VKGASVLLAAAVAAGCTFAFSRPARALGPIDIEAAASAGGATSPIRGSAINPPGSINPLGVGVGGRAGISLFGIYAGISGMYYFGGSTTETIPSTTVTPSTSVKVSETSWLYGFEAGYNLKILLLTIRPTVQVGPYTLHASVGGTTVGGVVLSGSSKDYHNIYVEPGVTALLGFGLWFVGADANVFVTPGLSGAKAAFMGNGQIGVKF